MYSLPPQWCLINIYAKQQLQQEIAELQKQLEEKQKALSAMPVKWELEGGEWYIMSSGMVDCTGVPAQIVASFGMEYATREQAEKAAKAMRAHNRLLAYVAEFAPDYEYDCGGMNWTVWQCAESLNWDINWYSTIKVVGCVYMPEHIAKELAAKLNSGEVQL